MSHQTIKSAVAFLRPGVPMFFVGASLFFLMKLAGLIGIPTPPELIIWFRPYFSQYGMMLTGAFYFIEGIFVINIYWPGSFVLFLSVLYSEKSVFSLAVIWLTINLSALAAIIVNSVIGRYGFHYLLVRFISSNLYDKISILVRRYGYLSFFIIGFHINWLSIAVVVLSSFRTRIAWGGIGVAWIAHLIWSIPLVWALGQLNIQTISNPNVSYVLIAVFLLAGFAMCLVKMMTERNQEILK